MQELLSVRLTAAVVVQVFVLPRATEMFLWGDAPRLPFYPAAIDCTTVVMTKKFALEPPCRVPATSPLGYQFPACYDQDPFSNHQGLSRNAVFAAMRRPLSA